MESSLGPSVLCWCTVFPALICTNWPVYSRILLVRGPLSIDCIFTNISLVFLFEYWRWPWFTQGLWIPGLERLCNSSAQCSCHNVASIVGGADVTNCECLAHALGFYVRSLQLCRLWTFETQRGWCIVVVASELVRITMCIMLNVRVWTISFFPCGCWWWGLRGEWGAHEESGLHTGEAFVAVADLELYCPPESFPCFSQGSVPEVTLSDVLPCALSRTPHLSCPPCTYFFACAPGRTASTRVRRDSDCTWERSSVVALSLCLLLMAQRSGSHVFLCHLLFVPGLQR